MKLPLRLLLSTLALMLIGFSARAGSISEEQAKAKAQSFLQARHPLPSGKRLASARIPRQLHSTPTGQTALYVFNVGEKDGFIIVAGDDRARSILGYADSGSFDADRMPAALREMMAIYVRQIELLGTLGAKADSLAKTRRAPRRISSTMADVTPLLTTTWNQTGPYNDYCPTLDDQTALTGCVATAMAQIAYYYKYPTSQVPSLAAYTSATNKINVSAWGATTFDWANMLNSYDGLETNAQKAAVATLMRYCGQAAQMDYGFTSGAYNGDALYAFTQKLGYNENATFKSATNYSINGWEDLIYKEVREGRPVYYSALNGNEGEDVGGHAFVIDGYQADGNYFHVNWGWGGASDGYFNLFALDPGVPQSAPTASGWHYQMLALIGLSPEEVNTAKLLKDASGSWLITSADDWNELSANLDAYNGGSFKLTADISVTTMVGTESVPFSGTFDGQGHVLNVNIESDGWGAAPFNYVNPGTTIKNLKTTGTVTCSSYHASGLVGGTDNDGNFDLIITNCEVAVQVNGSEHAGGFIGHAIEMNPIFTDCVFSGSINGSHDHGCFVGWKEWESRPVYVNCLSIPTSFEGDYTCDFSHPGMGEANASTLTNCYYNNASGFSFTQGLSVSPDQLASGFVAHALQHGSRDWTTGRVWGQQIGTDAVPVLTSDASKVVYKVQFSLDGQVVKTVFANSPIGDKMPEGEDFGLTNASFTCNGSAFTSTTTFNSDITVNVTGTAAFTLTLGTPSHGSISINNSSCMPGTVKKVTAIPANGYVVSTVTATDANGKALPVTQVSNNANEYVFVFPKSSVTVNAVFAEGEAEAQRFINGGMTLPLWDSQSWTADTWTIWSDDYSPTLGTPPADALGHQWYEEDYALTNSDADQQPNGNLIVWENHTAPFGRDRNYDYARACGGDEGPNNFYMRRVFTFNTETVPEKLYLKCNFDDAPIFIYINGTLVHQDLSQGAGSYSSVLTPDQIALIHTDGTPNVLAVRGSQGNGDYFLDCGLYDPTAISYEVTGENTVRVLRNEFITGDVVIPSTVTANGKTYTVTELADDVFNELHNGFTSASLPSTLTSLGNNSFRNCDGLQYVKSYLPVYLDEWLIAAPAAATEFEVSENCSKIWNNAFKFTESLTTLTLPRATSSIGENAFVGCTALTNIYAYARPVPQTEGNAFDGINKSAITVHVYASALNSYKQSWGEEFNYVTSSDPQPITLTVNVTSAGSLRTLIEEAAAQVSSTIYDVAGITVTGTINQDDLWTLSTMCTGVYSLATIDLSGVTIDDNYINNGMFRDREKLTSIILPETLEYINDEAFYNCDGLTAIDIPASVKRIWAGAFAFCDNLVTVTGLEGLTDAWDVFWGSAITQPVYGGTVFLYMPPSITGEYEVPSGIKMTAAGSMRDSQLSALILPASLTDIGDDTFQGCPNLVDIYCYAITPPTCHSGVWEFGFDRDACTVHVPASALSDYQNADEWRDLGRIVAIPTGELVDLTINVATAGTLNDEIFNAAVANANISDKVLIRNLTVTGNINADDVAYLNTLPNTLYNMEMLDMSGTTLEGNAITERMFYATLYKAVSLPATVTSIANEAFRTSRRLHEITLPDALESIGSYAFAGSGLTSITIPDGVTEIGDRGVQACSSLTTVTIGNGVTTIPDCWAEDCCNLEELTIGKNVTLIKWRSFCGSSLKNVYCYAKMPPSFGPDVPHSEINSEAVLHVYSNSLKRYQNANRWQDFTTILGDLGTYQTYDITVNVETMGTFSDALAAAMTTAGIEDLTDISKLTVTGNMNQADLDYLRDNVGAFLDKLDLGAVTVDGNNFGYQTLSWGGFEEVILPANLERMEGWSVLEDCHNLKSIVIPDNVTYLGPGTLGATALESVTIGKRVNFFGWRTFCATNIKDIYCLAKNPPAWDNDIFADGEYPEVLHVYSNCLERYQNANGWKDIPTILGDLGTYPSVDLTVYVSTMGTFNEALATAMTVAGCKDVVDIDKLTVKGSINNEDLYYFRDNLGAWVETLDLSAATVENNTINEYALAGCVFKELQLPVDLVSIGHQALAHTGLTSITIPDGVTGIGSHLLRECSALTSITIGDNLTEIPERITEECNNLEEVTLGKRIRGIWWNAFPGANIKHVYCHAKTPPSWVDAFYGDINTNAVLHVYSTYLERYESADGWKTFPNIVGDLSTYPAYDIAVNVATKGSFSEAFATAMTAAGCDDVMYVSKLTVTGRVNQDDLDYLRDNVGAWLDVLDLSAVRVEDNVLGYSTLTHCGFEELTLPTTITRIEEESFKGCVNLKTFDIPNSVNYVGPNILSGASSLEAVTGGNRVTDINGGGGCYFNDCPNLTSPVVLNQFFYRLPLNTVGAYEVPDHVTCIARDAMWDVKGLTSLTLPESINTILANVFCRDENLKDIYFYAVEVPYTDGEAFNDFDRSACTLHVYEGMVDVFNTYEVWAGFNIVGDLGSIPVTTPMNTADYADLCTIFNTLDGSNWRNKWAIGDNVQTASRWRGVTFDADGYVTSIEIGDNGLSGNLNNLNFTGLTKLTKLDMSGSALSGDIMAFKAKLPSTCKLYVERQDLGDVGEHTLYELCTYGGLPNIAYYRSESGSLASTLMGLGGSCQFYHRGAEGGYDWEGRIYADGGTWSNGAFHWPSTTTVECTYPHRFTFTYNFEMGDANMDDVLNVLDLQSTLNYSNGHSEGLFNVCAADTYGSDNDINVQDIVATVNILLAQPGYATARTFVTAVEEEQQSSTENEACISVENGEVVLYTTKPVAALDLRIAGIEPEALSWNTESMGFATSTVAQGDGTHAIVFSMLPREIAEGRTVLATFKDGLNPCLLSAVLSDSKAHSISVGKTMSTGIDQGKWAAGRSIYDMQGIKLNSPQKEGVYIVNGKKVVIK